MEQLGYSAICGSLVLLQNRLGARFHGIYQLRFVAVMTRQRIICFWVDTPT
jgi:hypothetical protein